MTDPLFKHQEDGVAFILARGGSGALFHDIGLGKTRTALQIYSRIRGINPNLKAIVICPISLIEATWREEIKNCFPQFVSVNLRKNKSITDGDIFICNYEWLHSPINIDALLAAVRKERFLCIIDESSRIKNHKAKTTKIVTALKSFFPYKLVMSGTPAPNSETEYWAQVNFVSQGVVNPKFSSYRDYYFHLARGNQVQHGKIVTKEQARNLFSTGWKYQITAQKRKDLMQRISIVAHFAKKKDCLDLPEEISQVRIIEMNDQQRKHYNEMKNQLITEIKNTVVTADVALAKLMKLRQITDGFAINEYQKIVEIGPSPKMNDLEQVLEEAGGQQVIIWAIFQHSIRKIKQALGHKAVTLYGETEDRDDSIKKFLSGQSQYLVAHPRSAAHGLTFVNCSLMIFHSLDYSWESYEQARGRIHRPGQKKACVYIHQVCQDSIDQDILRVLQGKQNAIQILESYLSGR